jgi:hypothetical protein
LLAFTGVAEAHFKPMSNLSYSAKVNEYKFREDHAKDVFRFFQNHPKLANTIQGRAAIWQHKKLLHWSQKELAELSDIRYINQWSYDQLADQARQEVRNGGTYSVRYGDCSERLKELSHELIERSFSRFGTVQWALYIVGRESGFCPGAVNTTYSSWTQQAQCIAQLIPAYHQWVDYKRCKSDPAYSVQVFLHLSDGGTKTGPWR